VEKHFVEADHKYLRQTAREIDASGLEKKRQEKIMEYQQLQVEQKRKKQRLGVMQRLLDLKKLLSFLIKILSQI
jgi:hypothetical protein